MTLSWGPNTFLSVEGTREFAGALFAGIGIAERLRGAATLSEAQVIVEEFGRDV